MIGIASLLVYTTPVALAALGETINEKAGSLNIGLEGTMLAGAFFAMMTSGATGSAWLGLGAGLGVGVLLSIVQAIFTIRLAVDQVVVGTALNLLALGLTGTIFRARYGDSGQLLSVPQVPRFGGIDPVVVALLVLTVLVTWMLAKTRFGLALRAAGEMPKAAEAAGFSVARLRSVGLVVSGALGGLAGAYLSLGIAGSFAENMTAGRGFVAIAMVTFGRWKPVWVVGASLFVGYAESLQFLFQSRGIGVPYQLLIALPYLLALAVLIGVGRGTAAPAALAIPFRKHS